MIQWFVNIVKNAVASKEIKQLERYRVLTCDYRRWLSEFEEVCMVLDNLQVQINGKDFLDEKQEKCLDISSLRDKMRKLKTNNFEKLVANITYSFIDRKTND